MHKYEIVIRWSEEDGVFVAEAPELAGCLAHGATPDEALSSCHAAIDLWIETAVSLGRVVPTPTGRVHLS